jgi:hypothetical protein
MEAQEPGQHFVIGPPPLPPLVMLGLAVTVLMVPVSVGSLLAGGSPLVAVGLVVPVAVWIDHRRLRRIRVTAWDHRLVIDNGKGSFGLDRDAIAGFEIAVPSTTVMIQEGPSVRGSRVWKGPLVQVVRHDGRRLPLIATVRRRTDTILGAHEARLETWLRPPEQASSGRQ